MKNKKSLALALSLVLLVTVLSACGAAPSVGGAVTFTDIKDREINLPAPAQKLVVTAASDCEILYALGAGDTIIGRGEYCDYPAEVSGVTSVGSGSETNIEQIIALAPDAVVMNTMDQTLEQTRQLENAGIPVIASEATDIAGVYECIEMLGKTVGKTQEAAQLIESMKAGFSEISADASGKSVYFEVSPLEYGLWTAGSGTFMDEVATLLGLKNAFSDVSGWAEISEEQVLERSPDYIVTISMYSGEGPTPTEEILSRKGWDSVPAVKNSAVLNLQNNELTRPGPRLLDGAKALHSFVYGA